MKTTSGRLLKYLVGTQKIQLTRYEQQINEASVELCLHNSELLSDCQLLLESSRKQVIESGYVYKKGKSRSRKLNPTSPTSPTKKRQSKLPSSKTDRTAGKDQGIVRSYWLQAKVS